jgi:tRNA A37 threonylcarbamoyladenosine dehydratase
MPSRSRRATRSAPRRWTRASAPGARFYDANASDELLCGKVDFVVDAIDNITATTHLIATCLDRKIPVVSAMGAAARMDPTKIVVADLSETEKDPFAGAVRRMLRNTHSINAVRGNPIGVDAVFSTEEPSPPASVTYDGDDGFRCVCPGGKNDKHDCERRSRIDGSASFVTGAFGLTAASVVVRRLLARVK